MTVDPRLLDYYSSMYSEAERLVTRDGPLEFVRTQELLLRYLPGPPARVLDVGGGPGRYAAWLAALGYDVLLLDVVPEHVEVARAHGTFEAHVGDARDLAFDAQQFDVVLLLGPLYHLRDAAERRAVLAGAFRVARPGALVAVAYICRSAAPLDGLVKGWIWSAEGIADVEESIAEGYLAGDETSFGTIGYFHTRTDAVAEIEASPLELLAIYGVEGPGWIAPDFEARWSTEQGRETVLRLARAVERDPELQILNPHLLAIARRPDT